MALPPSQGKKRVLRFDRDYDPYEGDMEFRLTFEGPLRASNTGDRDRRTGRKEYKHWVRQQFHTQLRELWRQTPFLNAEPEGTWDGPVFVNKERYPSDPYNVETLSERFALYGFNFVPLVTEAIGLLCGLEILYLRRRNPGDVLESTGDIDNRIKTLFDCLQIPDANQGYHQLTPSDDEKPFFCLLEDDKLVTKVSVETDRLLQDVNNPFGDTQNDARLVITVRIKPYRLDLSNIQFG